ncbi:MAG: GYD domain-containing protein [Dehalococcoidia bacterium]|nr:GYD domain-containing protein [Dehalococcoidia bacterium]
MAYYLHQAAYTPEAWKAQVENPQDVRERVQALLERLDGKIVGLWYSFGEYDIVVIFEFPGDVHAAAAAITVAAGGADKAAKTTPLLTIEEGLEAMEKASGSGYQPPGS